MKFNKKTIKLLLTALPLLASGLVRAEGVAVGQAGAKTGAISAAADNNSDGAFASDLKGAEDLLRELSRERKLTPGLSGEYMARELERAKKFFAFAKSTLIPHGFALRQKMSDPDGLIAEGKLMVEKNSASWQGYDYLASGSLIKRDVDGAKDNYEKALAAAPDFQKDWYRYMLAACYNVKKDPEKALALYEGIIEKNDNWLAVKNSYLGASMMLLGRDNGKAVSYFDKGFSLYAPGEQAALLKTSLCDKFRDLEKGPEACGKTN
ncbi:MAG: hypothetical protein Q7R35_15150 [Elusimicrobiota bacterium]|nr:hypothetical protein [Elusimicrobiota bacterium]